MGRKANPNPEFPLLSANGLQTIHTKGSGNCLFHALSDQMYGDQMHHVELRARVIEHLRENADHFKAFLDVKVSGGTRRQPKRKNAGGFIAPQNDRLPTEQERDAAFTKHLNGMARGGTYGDNLEIVAFMDMACVTVQVWKPSYQNPFIFNPEHGISTKTVHIAHHIYEHFSSVRRVGGPFKGPTDIPKIDLEKKGAKNNLAAPSVESPAYASDGSSSIERDQDTQDEKEFSGAKKKQDRRESQATKAKKTATISSRPKAIPKTYRRFSSTPSTMQASSDSEDDVYISGSSRSSQQPASQLNSDSEEIQAKKPASTSTNSSVSSPHDNPPKETSDPASVPAPPALKEPYRGTMKPSGTKAKAPQKPKISAAQRAAAKKQAQKTAAKEKKREKAGKASTTHAIAAM